MSNHSANSLWYLEGAPVEGGAVRRYPLLALPFRVGRGPGLGLTLSSPLASQRHAELYADGDQLKLRDLNSTNGTFLNGERLAAPQAIREGDILHFARFEYRLGRADAEEAENLLVHTIAVSCELPEPMVDKSRILREMMRRQDVLSAFQPIVALSDETILGYEILGRGMVDGSEASSSVLFNAAQLLDAEAELSRMFRVRSVRDCLALPGHYVFFINTHPSEIGGTELAESLRHFRANAPELKVVLEVHESTVASPAVMQELLALLRELDIGLAYDDFGAGQARLQELAEVTPDYLKFDISLIRELDRAPESRRRVLSHMIDMAVDLRIQTIAEGIEAPGEADACRELGFDFGQGYLFGAPLLPEELQKNHDTQEDPCA